MFYNFSWSGLLSTFFLPRLSWVSNTPPSCSFDFDFTNSITIPSDLAPRLAKNMGLHTWVRVLSEEGRRYNNVRFLLSGFTVDCFFLFTSSNKTCWLSQCLRSSKSRLRNNCVEFLIAFPQKILYCNRVYKKCRGAKEGILTGFVVVFHHCFLPFLILVWAILEFHHFWVPFSNLF